MRAHDSLIRRGNHWVRLQENKADGKAQAFLLRTALIVPRIENTAQVSIQEQSADVLGRLEDVLNEAGFEPSEVTIVRVYLLDPAHHDIYDQIYRVHFPNLPPARVTVGMSGLPGKASIALEAEAAQVASVQ